MKSKLMAAALGAALLASSPASADDKWTVSAYLGNQSALDSNVSGRDETGTPFSFDASWVGRSFEGPIYYGFRVMRDIRPGGWSLGTEFTHAKVYASDATLARSGFSSLEFSDGINILTVNAQKDVPLAERWTGYGGLGLGVSVPHVEVTTPSGARTFNYQLAGPAARWYVGASYAMTHSTSVFVEYNGTYSTNDVRLSGGGSLETNIQTNAINVGLGFSF